MIKKTFAAKNSSYSIVIISILSALVVGIWLYTAHCFEKNVIQAHSWLSKAGHITTGSVNINKYMLTANIDKHTVIAFS